MSKALSLLESVVTGEIPALIRKTEKIDRKFDVCPCCHEEIQEKSTFLKDPAALKEGADFEKAVWTHSCGGEFVYPPKTPEERAEHERIMSHLGFTLKR